MRKRTDTYFQIMGKIQIRMRERNVKQKDIAKFLGLNPCTVSQKFSNSGFTGIELCSILDYLDMDVRVERVN